MPSRKTSKARPRTTKRAPRTRKDTSVALPTRPAISRLPSELLVHIFKLSIEYTRALPYSWRVCHHWWHNGRAVLALVCQLWKDIIYGNRLFWTTVDMTLIKRRRLCIANAQSVPLQAVWNINSRRKPPKFPLFLFRRLSRAGTMTSLQVTDDCSALEELDDIDLSSVRKFSFENRGGFIPWGTSAIRLRLIMPSLTSICLSAVPLRGEDLLNLSQQVGRTLESINLQHCNLDDDTLITQRGLSLPQLKHLKVSYSNRAMRSILYAVKDASPDAILEICAQNTDLVEMTKMAEFRRVFSPLKLVHVRAHQVEITFSEEKRTSRPRLIASVTIQSSLRNPPGDIFFDRTVLHSEVLEMLRLEGLPFVPVGVMFPIDIFPPSRTWEILSAYAMDVLSWLAKHKENEHIAPLETIILIEVPLMNTSPYSPLVRDIVTEDAAMKRWGQHYQMFTDLLAFLRARHEDNRSVDLVLRGGGYEDGVVRDLRPFVNELIVEDDGSANTEPRHSSRLAAKAA